MLTTLALGIIGVSITFLLILLIGLIISWVIGDTQHNDILEIFVRGLLGTLFLFIITGVVGFLMLVGHMIQCLFK